MTGLQNYTSDADAPLKLYESKIFYESKRDDESIRGRGCWRSEYDSIGSEKRVEEASAHWLRQSIGTIFEKRHGYVDLPWNWLTPSGSGLSTVRKAVHRSSSEDNEGFSYDATDDDADPRNGFSSGSSDTPRPRYRSKYSRRIGVGAIIVAAIAMVLRAQRDTNLDENDGGKDWERYELHKSIGPVRYANCSKDSRPRPNELIVRQGMHPIQGRRIAARAEANRNVCLAMGLEWTMRTRGSL